MKYIKIGLVLCGMFLIPSVKAVGTAIEPESKDSLVHIAYTAVSNKDLAGGISVLKPSEYLDKSYSTYALEGAEAFVGGSSLWGMGNALVLVDGVPRSIDNITTSEIDQITFLKGANAVVLYGSRAANGVILITTKRGKVGDRQINVRAHAGINTPKAYPQYIGSAEYMTYYNQACINDGIDPLYDKATIYNYGAQVNPYRYPDVDYYSSDYLRKFYNSYSAEADFTGGTERARFYAQAGILNNNSLLNFGEGKKEGTTRLNIRGNVDLKLNDYIKTYVNVSTVFYNNHSALGDFWNKARTIQPHRYSPMIPIDMIDPDNPNLQLQIRNSRHIIDGKYLLGGSQQYLTNPIADAYAGGYIAYTSRQFQFTGGLDINLNQVLKGLSFHGAMSIDYSNTYNESVNNTYAVYVADWGKSEQGTDIINGLTKHNKDMNTGTQNLSDSWNHQTIDFNVHFDYTNTFQEKHNVSAILLAAATRMRQTGDFQYETNANMGLQLGYNFSQTYYASFGGALVNSTRLASAHRLAFSPTVGVGWVLSEEAFMQNARLIDRLKLTASAGILHTDLLFPTDSETGRPLYFLYDAVYMEAPGYGWHDGKYSNNYTSVTRGENLKLGYAKRKEINVGIEGSFFNNLLNMKANLFFTKLEDIPVIAATQYPSYFQSGYPKTSFIPYTNFNANQYRGFDFQIDLNKKVGQVNLQAGVSGTYVTSKALKRDELYADSYRNRVGQPTDAIFGLQSEGLFMNQAEIDERNIEQKFGEVKPGDIKYKDQNNDGVIDERDEVMIGRWGAPFSYGVHLTAQWKDFTLFLLGTGSVGGTGVKTDDYYWVNGDKKYSVVVRDSWTEKNPGASYPRLTTTNGSNNFRYSDFWTYSTNRFDLAKVQLTYSLPHKIIQSSFIKDLKVYVSGSNLLTIAKNREILELNLGSPQCRFYNLGVKVEF